jgi:pSer/pThr/pTyr-binding forkhead associated (FHA) protein
MDCSFRQSEWPLWVPLSGAIDMDAARPKLTLLACPDGHMVEVEGPSALVGRHSEADLQLPRTEVSRRHCRLLFDNGGWRVVDLSSTNGTFVNEVRVEEAELHPGDHLRIGGFEFDVPGEAARVRSLIRSIADVLDAETRKAS